MNTEQRSKLQDRRVSAKGVDEVTKSSFRHNLDPFERIVEGMERELRKTPPNINLLRSYRAEIQKLAYHLRQLRDIIVVAKGHDDRNVQRFDSEIKTRYETALVRFKMLLGDTDEETDVFQAKRSEDKSPNTAGGSIDNTEPPREDAPMTDLTRQEVDAKLAQNKAEIDARLANFDTSVKTGFADLRTEFAHLRTEMQKTRGDFERQSHDSTKWIIGSVFGMISLAVAIIGVMINLNKAEKPTAPATPPAPIVITVPGNTTAAPQTSSPAQPSR